MSLLIKIIKAAFQTEINNAKGDIGEAVVSAHLSPLFFDDTYHKQIDDLMLIDKNGNSHQIDHVDIRPNGIFCIETKNYSGLIFGNESQSTWTQVLYHEKHRLPNPIRQNRTHIYCLNQVLGTKYKVHSVIVMVKNNADKINVPYVINLIDLRSYLSNYNDGTLYSVSEMENIYQALCAASRSDLTKEEHIANVQATQRSIQNNICPRCGRELVLRMGKYGSFYGCTGYPSCRFTRKI